MEKHRTVRAVAALLMLLALVLPVAPGTAAAADEIEVRAAHLSTTFDLADCTVSNNGDVRYFATIQSTSGVDIANATGRLVYTGAAPLPAPFISPVNMFNGDFESQAADGSQTSCVPAVNDGHANDIGSPFIPSFRGGIPPTVFPWTLLVSAPGFIPAVPGALPTVLDAVAANCQAPFPAGTQADRQGCLISLGTIRLDPLGAPAGRGVVSGTVFATNGLPLDGATVTLRDASGNVHTRVSGTNCDGAARAQTGFYCFAASAPTGGPVAVANDGLGLPVGPAIITVVNNTVANCGAGAAAPGIVCGFLPATVTVNVAASTVSGQDITLQNKFAPAAGAPAVGTSGAFGYIVNDAGQGVGGITVSACTAAAAAVVASNCPAGTGPVASALSSTQTGLWALGGLTVGTTQFAISGPGLVAQNVRPGLVITRAAGLGTVAGLWIDPSWIIVLSTGPGAVTLPIVGSAIIRGQVIDSQGAPFSGTGGFVLLYRNSTRDLAAGTNFGPATVSPLTDAQLRAQVPSINPVGAARYFPLTRGQPFVAAAALDSGGNYCFGASVATAAGTTSLCGLISSVGVPQTQPALIPDEYIVTVVDDRAVNCVAGFQPPPGGIGPAPCGHLPQTSQPVIAQSDRIATVNFALQARYSPGAVPGPFPGVPGGAFQGPTGTLGVFGFIWDAGVPGGRPVQGQTVYAVPLPAGVTPPTAATLTSTVSGANAEILRAFLNFTAQIPLTGPGVLGGVLSSSNPAAGPVGVTGGGLLTPTYPGSDAFGMYRIHGLQPGLSYAIIAETPQGYNNCAPNNVNVGSPISGFPFSQTGLLQPTGIIRCAIAVTMPAAAAAATTPWVGGVDFALAPQLLRPVEPGEIDRRLEHVLPLVANGAPTAPLGGWDVNTTEIHVVNAGAQRTVAEVRFYASDGLGGAGVLAGTATADLMPGGARVFRGAEIPGGFLGWVGVWAFDADGPGGVYGQSSLAVTSNVSVRNADNAAASIAGISREHFASPQNQVMVPLAYKNYGGSGNLWSSLLVSTNMGDSAPVVFHFRQQDRLRGDARSCQPCLITRYANRGGVVTLNLGDDNDPDVALLGAGTYSVLVAAGGPLIPSGQRGMLPGAAYTANYPGGHVANVLNVTTTGKMATSGKASQAMLGETPAFGSPGPFDVENSGGLYAPLLFNNYNGWQSAIAVSTGQTSGGVSAIVTATFYDEAGGFVGEYNDRVSQSSPTLMLYLPALQFIPEGFRGTAILRSAYASGEGAGLGPGVAVTGQVIHVNYDRNHAMSYNIIGSSAITTRGEALGELPCISVGFTTCAWAADVNKTGAITAEGGLGSNTGIRIMNVDPPGVGAPFASGLQARVIATYIDNSGVMWNDATQEFVIPAFGVHTLFPAYNRRLPDVFRGTVRLMSTGNAIVAVAHTVDYSVTGRDASGAYNLQYHTGRTE